MSNDDIIQKFSIRSLLLLSFIAIVSISMISAPIFSSIMYIFSNSPPRALFQIVNAQNGDDSNSNSESDSNSNSESDSNSNSESDSNSNSESDSNSNSESDSNSESSDSDSLSSTPATTDSTSSTTTDTFLIPPSTATEPSIIQNPITLTDPSENSTSSSNDNNGDQDLNCDDIPERNFVTSSDDPNGFDNDNDSLGCESNGDDNSNGTSTSPVLEDNEGPDGDCLFNASLPKCDPDENGNCPDGFNLNEDGNCFPDHNETGCPDGYHGVDDDETGQCYPNEDGCPEGMIFRPDGKTCGYKDQLCQDDSDLDGCVETPQECDNNYDDDSDGLTDSEDPDCGQQECDPSYPDDCISSYPPDLNCDEIPYRDFKVNGADPHNFDGDNDGIGCETGDNDDNDNDNGNNDDSDVIRASQDTSCDDISDTIDLFPGQLDSERVKIIAYFEDCDLDVASLTLNIVEDDDLKLVAANFEDGESEALEVELEPINNDDSDTDNSLYEATILGTQEGLDLETGDSKTISNVNGIVLWNNGDDPIQFAENNSIEFDIDFD